MSTGLPPRVTYGTVPFLSIFVGEKKFDLTAEEIATEPNSIFNEVKRASSLARQMPSLNADAHLFRLIHAHLQGYEIFPLPEGGIPFGRGTAGTMNEVFVMLGREATMWNLLRDAKDFGLLKLVAKTEREIGRLGLIDRMG